MFGVVQLMGYKISTSKCFTVCLLLTFVMGCYLASLPIQEENDQQQIIKAEKKHLAIIVPFRDRFEELLEFVPHMHQFLNKQNIPFHIFIIQQKDINRFNRASLINVGYKLTQHNFDYFAMHDVDLLPLNDNLKYEYPDNTPIHISSPATHPKYSYKSFIGGILLIKREHFELVNGMSNRYWGWGLEDDEFYVRLKDSGFKVERPANITTGRNNTFKHIHDQPYRKRDMRKCFNQREETRKRDRQTGLHDLSYELLSTNELTIDKIPFTVYSVELKCNVTSTPWCRCPDPKKKS